MRRNQLLCIVFFALAGHAVASHELPQLTEQVVPEGVGVSQEAVLLARDAPSIEIANAKDGPGEDVLVEIGSDDDTAGETTSAEEGAEEEEEDVIEVSSKIPTKKVWAIAAIITILVLFTLLFEKVKEHIVEEVKGSPNEPIVSSIFAELTVLGFLALVCFMINQFGLDHLSALVFGPTEEEKLELGEMVESIHMVIFLVMMIFVAEALGMLVIARGNGMHWHKQEGRVLTTLQRIDIAKEWKEMNVDPPDSWELYWQWSDKARKYKEMRSLMVFMLLRQEFINDENEDLALTSAASLPRDFSFTLYLAKVLGERLGEIVELPIAQWVTLEATAMLFLLATATLASGAWLFLLVATLCWAWLMLLLAHLFLRSLKHTVQQLVHKSPDNPDLPMGVSMIEAEARKHGGVAAQDDLSKADAEQAAGSETTPAEPEGSATSSQEGPGTGSATATETDPLNKTVEISPPDNNRKWIDEIPQYQLDASLDTSPWWVPCRDSKNSRNVEKRRFYNLFAYGKDEVHFHLYVIRFFFLATAVYLAVFIWHIVPSYIVEAYDTPVAILLTTVGLVPAVLVYCFYMNEITDTSILCTSVEYFRHRRMVESVKRHQKEDRAVMLLRIACAFHIGDVEPDAGAVAQVQEKLNKTRGTAHNIEHSLDEATGLELEAMLEMFEELDVDQNGYLSKDEIIDVLKSNGFSNGCIAEHAESSAFMKGVLSESTSDDAKGGKVPEGNISQAEFLHFMQCKEKEAKALSADEVAKFCFTTLGWDSDTQLHKLRESTTIDSGQDESDHDHGHHEEGGWCSCLSQGHEADEKLSVEELQVGLATLGQAFTPNEISQMVIALDVNNDGEFSEEELAKWIELHSNKQDQTTGVFGLGVFGL